MCPIARHPTAMHDRDDEYIIEFHGVEDCLGKDRHEVSSYVLRKYSPPIRRFYNLPKRQFDTVDRSAVQPLLTSTIV